MIRLIIFILLSYSFSLSGQNLFVVKEIKGYWFASNTDSSFYKSDTIVLIKKLNKQQDLDLKKYEREFLESESKILNSAQFVELIFSKKNDLRIGSSDHDIGVRTPWEFFDWYLKKIF